ncbi:hypothetical protein D1872_224370 [compost metagenome]
MRILVQQHAAAFTGPGGPPAAGIVVALRPVPVGDDPVRPPDLAQLPGEHQVPQFGVKGIGALVVHNPEFPAGFGGGQVHVPDGFGVDAGGFFDQDMVIAFKSLRRQCRVIVMRGSNQDGIHGAGGEERVRIGKGPHRFGQVLLRPLKPFRIAVANGRKPGPPDVAQKLFGMGGPHISDADDTKSYLIHWRIPAFPSFVRMLLA